MSSSYADGTQAGRHIENSPAPFFVFASYIMALEMEMQILLWGENWEQREACAFPAEPLGTRVLRQGASAAATDGLSELNCANVPFLCSSRNLCPIPMLLRSGNSELMLLTHIPHHLTEHAAQFNLKHRPN